MDERDRRTAPQRPDERPRLAIDAADATTPIQPVTLWRMRSAAGDNQASCSVTGLDATGCTVLILFAKGLGVPERFANIDAAMHHAMEIAGRLIALGWTELDLRDDAAR